MDGRDFQAVDCVVMDVSGSNGKPDKATPVANAAGLLSVLPNPFNPATRVSYFLPAAAAVRLSIYDVSGRLVEKLVDGPRPSGEHTVEWNASSASSGIYFCRFEAGGVVETRKLVLIR